MAVVLYLRIHLDKSTLGVCRGIVPQHVYDGYSCPAPSMDVSAFMERKLQTSSA